MSAFKKATKSQARLRLAFIGTAGVGKTYSSLSVAQHLIPGGRVAVIDTERGSASKYADLFDFDVRELESYSPLNYIHAIECAEREKYDIVIVDSLSHAWTGKDGALEQKDLASKRDGNQHYAWREVTPQHNRMVDTILGCKAHVIVTMRAKSHYVQDKDANGKTVFNKMPLAPIQRDGLEYEFDVVGTINTETDLTITKTRCPALKDKIIPKPGEAFAGVLRDWLSDGVPLLDASLAVKPVPALEEFLKGVLRIHTASEAVSFWMYHIPMIRKLTDTERTIAWTSLCKHTREVCKLPEAAVWLKEEIKKRVASPATELSDHESMPPDSPPAMAPEVRPTGSTRFPLTFEAIETATETGLLEMVAHLNAIEGPVMAKAFADRWAQLIENRDENGLPQLFKALERLPKGIQKQDIWQLVSAATEKRTSHGSVEMEKRRGETE